MKQVHIAATNDNTTLIDLLDMWAKQKPNQPAYTFLTDRLKEGGCLTYKELDQHAKATSVILREHVGPGDRAVLIFPAGLEFLVAFYGCLYANVIAIPACPPHALGGGGLNMLNTIVQDAKASLILSTSTIRSQLQDGDFFLQGLPCLSIDNTELRDHECWKKPHLDSGTIAYLQYTSGSTSTPKGVMISHGNLMHHAGYINRACGYAADSIALTWLPNYHDYGLVDGLILPLYTGIPCYIMSSFAFLKKPINWLRAVSRYRVTNTQGPNFAYEHCLRKITPEQCVTLDLSSLRVASNAAEPVRKDTVERFCEKFGACGFRREALYPIYGLAEATLFVATKRHGDVPATFTVDADSLRRKRVVAVDPQDENGHALVSCGPPICETTVVIANPETATRCKPDEVGEIWVSDPGVAQGYWQKPEDTETTFHAYLADTKEGPYLRTGDLGFMKNGQLVVTGRKKDLIIIRGQNYYPQDIELTTEKSHPALNGKNGAAFGITMDGEERLVVVQGVDLRHLKKQQGFSTVIESIRQAIIEAHGLFVYAIALVKPGNIPKTSSGKIQRHTCRTGFLESSLSVVHLWQSSLMDTFATPEITRQTTSHDKNSFTADAIQDWIKNWLVSKLKIRPEIVVAGKPIIDYGLDSMAAVALILDLENWLGQPLANTLAWNFPSLEEMSQFLAGRHQASVLPSDSTSPETLVEGLDLDAEAVLDPDIRIEGKSFRFIDEPEIALLTGATGFLGSNLLHELLQWTRTTVHCLVRAVDTDTGASRVKKALASLGLWQPSWKDRIKVIVGDLSRPRLGLSSERFLQLAEQVDVIYHCAAEMNFISSYTTQKAVNVSGTREILRIASKGQVKPVHYVSSFSFVSQAAAHPEKAMGGMSHMADVDLFNAEYAQKKMADMGYVQSKRVADQLVMAAGKRGIPVTVYRPLFISGHSRTGMWNVSSYICRLIKGCILLGEAPDQDVIINLSPVDYVSRVIRYLSMQETSLGRGFDILNLEAISWNDLVDWIADYGYPVRRLAPDEWRMKLFDAVRVPEHPLYPLLPLFGRRPLDRMILGYPSHFRSPEILAKITTIEALAGTSITCPPVNETLLNIYFSYFIRSGFLEPPGQSNA